jgi:hypothetical protein
VVQSLEERAVVYVCVCGCGECEWRRRDCVNRERVGKRRLKIERCVSCAKREDMNENGVLFLVTSPVFFCISLHLFPQPPLF